MGKGLTDNEYAHYQAKRDLIYQEQAAITRRENYKNVLIFQMACASVFTGYIIKTSYFDILVSITLFFYLGSIMCTLFAQSILTNVFVHMVYDNGKFKNRKSKMIRAITTSLLGTFLAGFLSILIVSFQLSTALQEQEVHQANIEQGGKVAETPVQANQSPSVTVVETQGKN